MKFHSHEEKLLRGRDLNIYKYMISWENKSLCLHVPKPEQEYAEVKN